MHAAGLKAAGLAAGLALAALVIAIYYPALSSGFLLDDANNLAGLGAVPAYGVFHYVFSGMAGPAGRPLSLLSFALQHGAWPGNPAAFKSVNLGIHLACGVLILYIVGRLGRSLRLGPRETLVFAFGVAGMWLLHPLQLSTVLYTVQRMTQLSSFFILLGVALYLAGRARCGVADAARARIFMGAAVWTCTLLAVLCKENGILLPLFLLVLDGTVPAANDRAPALQRWRYLVLGLPLVALAAYLALTFEKTLASYGMRPYTMGERLMTEAVVLIDYLGGVLLPRPGAYWLYHDDFPVSHGLLNPPATLFSVLLITALLAAAWRWRKRYAVFSFSILWFFAGHVLESGFINLELYYEHRNYVPSLGPLVFIAWLGVQAGRSLRARTAGIVLLVVFNILIVTNTVEQIRLWRDPLLWHEQMVERHPGSVRAVVGLGNQYLSRGMAAEGRDLYTRLAARYPKEIYPRLKLLAMRACIFNEPAGDSAWREILAVAGEGEAERFGVTEEVIAIASAIAGGDCRPLAADRLIQLVVTLALNPALRDSRANLHEVAARLGVAAGDAGVAYHNVMEAVTLSPTVPRQFLKTQILLALGREEEARGSLASLMEVIDGSPAMKLAYGRRLDQLQAGLQ